MFNLLVGKLVVGDSFAEIVKMNRKGEDVLVNLLPISPERVRVVFGEDKQIKRYDVYDGKKWKPLDKEKMFHSIGDRLADQIHGTSKVDAVKFAIDFRNELLHD